MKKILKIIALLLFLGFVGIQFVRPERTNPPVKKADTLEANVSVPKAVGKILERSCNDCHSNQTVFPWYSNIAPVSWSVVDHIRVGRRELNFSEWGTYSESRRKRKLEEICEEVEERNMPHRQYLWIHRDAYLSASDIETLCDWTKKISDEVKIPPQHE